MPELDWKAPAIADLLAIIDYISDDNPDAALALMDEIQGKVAQLPTHPKRCRLVEWREQGSWWSGPTTSSSIPRPHWP